MAVVGANVADVAASYNETTVRLRIIDPIIKKLGYFDGENVYMEVEEKLSYPYIHIGRRSGKDVPVGYPDYRVGIKGARGSFIVEAKAASIEISSRDIEQAHSYAAHAQVGANYFVICNGLEFRVYETLSGPHHNPLISIHVSDLNDRFFEIENILSPDRLERNCRVKYDLGLKLCDGAGSSIAVRAGKYTLSDYKYTMLLNGVDQTELFRRSMPNIEQIDSEMELFKSSFQTQVDKGEIFRDADGRILARVELGGATVHNKQGMSILGIDNLFLAAGAEFLSVDSNNPTIFESTQDFSVGKGDMMPKLFGGHVQIANDVSGELFVKSAIHLDTNVLCGDYIALAAYHVDLPGLGSLRIELDLWGEFNMTVDL